MAAHWAIPILRELAPRLIRRLGRRRRRKAREAEAAVFLSDAQEAIERAETNESASGASRRTAVWSVLRKRWPEIVDGLDGADRGLLLEVILAGVRGGKAAREDELQEVETPTGSDPVTIERRGVVVTISCLPEGVKAEDLA